jgi:phage tail sheath gpL-like
MSGTTIPFNEIPPDYRVPHTMVEIRPQTNIGAGFAWPARALILGQTLGGTAGSTTAAVRVTRKQDAVSLFGAGSQAAMMAAAFLAANPFTPLTVIGLADPASATRATGTITFTAAPSQNGVMLLYIAGISVPLSVTTADTVTTMATRLVTAISANPDLPVTAASVAGVVTLSAKHLGAVGNDIYLAYNVGTGETQPFSLSPTIVSMSGGTLTPDLATAIGNIASDWYTDVIAPSFNGAAITALVTEAERRYTAAISQDMHVYAGYSGTYSASTTFGSNYNAKTLSVVPANGSPSPPWIWAAVAGAVGAFHLTNDPARQLRTLALPGVLPPLPSTRFIDSERDGLLRAGMSTFTVGLDGTVAIERMITTYRSTSAGAADTAWLDIMSSKTLSRIRYDWRQYVRLTYPRAKLAADGSIAAETDPSVITPRAMANAWAARCKVYAAYGWIQNEQITIPQAVFQISTTDPNRMDGRLVIQIMGNLMVFAAALEFTR